MIWDFSEQEKLVLGHLCLHGCEYHLLSKTVFVRNNWFSGQIIIIIIIDLFKVGNIQNSYKNKS